MSLYFEAASVLTSNRKSGSLKSLIYDTNASFKSKPGQIYALIVETSKYDVFFKDVIEKAEFLALEPKISPLVSILLIHDHFFSKGGIAAPTRHPLRQAVERHKALLQAEFTKARLRHQCVTVEELKNHLRTASAPCGDATRIRWVRVNKIKGTLSSIIETAFAGYTVCPSLRVLTDPAQGGPVLYIDENIPELLALGPSENLSRTAAYRNGEIVLQDKASCFPAQLLLASASGAPTVIGDVIDACAAPGNKTSQLASIMSTLHFSTVVPKPKVYACERNTERSQTLKNMLHLTGAMPQVSVLEKQDFLALDPLDPRFQNVTHLLLDPSCSGSGIITREDVPTLTLPEYKSGQNNLVTGKHSRKRKRGPDIGQASVEDVKKTPFTDATSEEIPEHVDTERLRKLSNLQTRIVEHAFAFPAAVQVTYSTCSVHTTENEQVVARALASPAAQDRGWRVLRRDEQVAGLRDWKHRGVWPSDVNGSNDTASSEMLDEEQLSACIRCVPATVECTMGFFVCGFVRDTSLSGAHASQEEEWGGFDD